MQTLSSRFALLGAIACLGLTFSSLGHADVGLALGAGTGKADSGDSTAVPERVSVEITTDHGVQYDSGRYHDNGENGGRMFGRSDIVTNSMYGYNNLRVEYSPSDGSAAVTNQGLGGWEILGANPSHPTRIMFGLEPLNFVLQADTNLPQYVANKAKNTVAKDNGVDPNSPQAQQVIGNTSAPVGRQQLAMWIPSVAVGLEHLTGVRMKQDGVDPRTGLPVISTSYDCRILGLVRGGLPLFASLDRNNNLAYNSGFDAAAFGIGGQMSCPGLDVIGEVTRIQSGHPMDIADAEVAYMPLETRAFRFGLGLTEESIINHEDKSEVAIVSPGSGDQAEHRLFLNLRAVIK